MIVYQKKKKIISLRQVKNNPQSFSYEAEYFSELIAHLQYITVNFSIDVDGEYSVIFHFLYSKPICSYCCSN